ncbi:MAG: VOC family protein [Gemmatimonadota bacterium]
MPRVVHFEIHATDPDRLVAFYEGLFGWRIQKWDGEWEYWMIVTGDNAEPGINGGLLRRQGAAAPAGQSVNAFVCTLDVPDVDDVLARLAEQGGTVAVPKMMVPGVGWLAYIKDPDGNILGVMQAESKTG